MTPENVGVSFLLPAAKRALNSLQEEEGGFCLSEAASKRRVNRAATQVFTSGNALCAASYGKMQQSARGLIADLSKTKSQCGVQEQNEVLSPLVAPQLNMGSIVQQALSPTEVLRKKAEEDKRMSGHSLSLLDTVERNRRLDEMTDAQIAAGTFKAMGDAVAWAAKKVCRVHPSVTSVCRATKTAAVESVKYVLDHTPEEIRKPVAKILEERQQNIRAEAIHNTAVYQIPIETTELHHHNLAEVSASAVLGWGTGKAISVAGRALGRVAKHTKDVTEVIVHQVGNARTVRKVTKAAMEVLDEERSQVQCGKLSPKITQLYQLLKIPNVYFPKITAVGKQINQYGQIDGIFEMSSLPGTPMGMMMKEVGLAAPNSPARNVLLENVNRGMDQVAGFLAALHNKSLPFKSNPSPKYISAEIDRIRLLYNIATEDLKLNLTMGKTDLEELIHHFKMNPGSGGMTHGDAHLRNFFYHPKGLQSIDHQKLTRSLGAKGTPIGVSIKDYEQMQIAAETLGRSVGVDAKELALIRDRFETVYWHTFKGTHTPEAIKFYRWFWSIDRLVRGFEDKLLQQEFLNQFNAEWGASSFNSVLKLPPREERRLAAIIDKSRQLPALGEEAAFSDANVISAVKEISPASSYDLDQYLFQAASRGRPIEIIPVGRRVDLYAADHLGYVKKTDEVQKILREVKALSLFKELNLQHSQVPEILGVQILGGEAQLFTSRLPGVPIRDVLEVMTINHEKHRSKEAVALAHRSMKNLGKALGELHSNTVKSKYEIDPARIQAEVVQCRTDYQVVKDYAQKHNMKLPHHSSLIERLAADYCCEPGFAAFVSDDPHFGNFLFDPSTSKISLVDLSAHYVTSQGIPQANPIRYFHRTLINLESDAMDLGMTSEERQSFTKALREGYESTFAGGVPQSSDRFNRVAAQYEKISGLIKQIPIANTPGSQAYEEEIRRLIINLSE